jgi:hypothetical protein
VVAQPKTGWVSKINNVVFHACVGYIIYSRSRTLGRSKSLLDLLVIIYSYTTYTFFTPTKWDNIQLKVNNIYVLSVKVLIRNNLVVHAPVLQECS